MSATSNFEFRVPPRHGERGGRFYASDAVVIGAPVKATSDADPLENPNGAVDVELATGAQAPERGLAGICVYEHLFGGDTGISADSLNKSPGESMVQVVFGDPVKVVLRNTDDRMMVAGLGATPTLEVGDWLTPGAGDDSTGYWAETATESEAWLVIDRVDAAAGYVEARMLF